MSPQTTDLYTALQWHLPWHKARVKFIAAFVLALEPIRKLTSC